jgi:Family of unknown function (DUF6011)
MATFADLPDGYYAIDDPHHLEQVTYWRRAQVRSQFGPWPPKARYGPVLRRSDVPDGLSGQARDEWVRRWFTEVREPYDAAVREAIAADPVAAGKRFADLLTRCCLCGRKLSDARSKVYGIGPECRQGISAEVLAAYFVPRVGRAHRGQS